MLIWIKDESVADLASGSKQTILALEYLATAHREGKHIIAGNRNTLETIVASDNIDDKTKAVYNRLISNATELWNIRKKLSAYIEVIEKEGSTNIDKSSGKNIIRFPISFFRDSYNLQKTFLLCESLNDGKFYKFVGIAYTHEINAIKILIELDNLSLSGGNASAIYEEKAKAKPDEQRLALCILDSDKVAPNCSRGSTANGVIAKHANYSPAFMSYYILESREVENILPFKFIEKICASDTNKVQIVKSLNSFLTNTTLEEIYPFLDLKNGTYLHEPIKKVVDPKSIDFWKSKSQIIIKQNPKCIEDWFCVTKNNKGQECSCSISQGLGEIMDDIIKYIEDDKTDIDKLAREIWQHLSPFQKAEWERIGSNIISWGASLSRSFSS
ncbi:MAG: hypothetical protein ACK5U6_14245 [Pseudanabaena sp.]|jgi:hypothetical protein|nr:hypothetical protein [Pseudanabaena sp. M090S1SP2A07QC]MCA6605121.1 hypothetical protein [Pseudanabaena sp. M007S1SP1A06QC]